MTGRNFTERAVQKSGSISSNNQTSLVKESVEEGLGVLIRENVSAYCKVFEDVKERRL